ncbi:LOW QUALITY PROTEIN: sperm flagellar protein 1 [Rhynochetos jubatus]
MGSGGTAGELRGLYRWLDAVPLSRPRRNIARDFSDGVLAAEVVKFFFPPMVQLHSYEPASSTPQKLANWGHLNRKVLSQQFSVPEDVVRQVVQCRPGTVEQVLLLLRQKIQEKQKRSEVVAGPGQVRGAQGRGAPRGGAVGCSEARGAPRVRRAGGRSTPPAAIPAVRGGIPYGKQAGIQAEGSQSCRGAVWALTPMGDPRQEPGARAVLEELSYLDTGYSKGKSDVEPAGMRKSRPGCVGGDAAAPAELAEREQALLLAQETIQILQLKVGRLEQLLRLKNVRIDDLSRRLQEAQRQRR